MGSLSLLGAGPSAGGAAFSPASLPNLAGWWKADAGTSTTTDGVGISQWNDQSAGANHLVQATGSLQPLYKAAIQNGLPVVRFDGVDDFLRATFTLAQPIYLFAVLVQNNVFAANTVSIGGATGGSSIFRNASTTYGLFGGTGTLTVTTTPQSWHVMGGLLSGASSEFRADGGTATTGSPGATGMGGITLGADNVPSQFASTDIGEVIALSAAPSAGDRTSTEGYLKTRWGTP